MVLNPKLLAAHRAKVKAKGPNPSPIHNPVGDAGGGVVPFAGVPETLKEDAPAETEPVTMDEETPTEHPDLTKALTHLAHVKKRAKGALAVHAKLALHHMNKYAKAGAA